MIIFTYSECQVDNWVNEYTIVKVNHMGQLPKLFTTTVASYDPKENLNKSVGVNIYKLFPS